MPASAMKPTQSLPETYQHSSTLDLSKDKKLAVGLNLIGLVLFVISGNIFTRLALVLRGGEEFNITFDNVWLVLLGSVLAIAFMLIVHEGIHGLSFWILTRGKPHFGFRGPFYAYAAAPDWYFPRREYFIVALAPLVAVTLIGILLMPIVSPPLLPFLLLWIILNFSGAVGDMATVILLLRKPSTIYINDFGDGVSIYCCEQPSREI